MIELLLAYGAGLLTLINPCVLPILPIVLASAAQSNRRGPLALAAGLSVTFVVLGVGVASIGPAFGITEEAVAQAAAVAMIAFGAVLLTPQLNERFAAATSGFSASADAAFGETDQSSLRGQFLGGALLGAVWSPCVGPTLGGAIALASQGQNLGWAAAVMTFFALGVSTVVLALAYGAREAIRARQERLRAVAEKAKLIAGAVFVVVGLMIFFRIHHMIEAWLLNVMPIWLQDLSVAL